jgi:predicted  nucleic acid-binding Zn-ribbon protein
LRDMSQDPHQQGDALSIAYEERAKQLYEARGALAEAVSTLRQELGYCREERDQALTENTGLRQHAQALTGEIEKLRHYASGLEGEVQAANERTAAVLNMKAVRWTARPRRTVQRLRARRKLR